MFGAGDIVRVYFGVMLKKYFIQVRASRVDTLDKVFSLSQCSELPFSRPDQMSSRRNRNPE